MSLAAGIVGSVLGALFNYWVAVRLGRPLLLKYGRYFLVSEESVSKAEGFFWSWHGHVSTSPAGWCPSLPVHLASRRHARMPLWNLHCLHGAGRRGGRNPDAVGLGYLLGKYQREGLGRHLARHQPAASAWRLCMPRLCLRRRASKAGGRRIGR